MVGRSQTVGEISEQLRVERFVAIVGPGGIGKSTVAVSVGHELLAEFAGAVQFFDLGPINDPLLISSAVASRFGLLIQSSDPTPGLVAALRDKRMLLIFDSCEHVIEIVAALAERIFEGAPEVHILATSREPLRVEGEHVHRLTALGSPPADRKSYRGAGTQFSCGPAFRRTRKRQRTAFRIERCRCTDCRRDSVENSTA